MYIPEIVEDQRESFETDEDLKTCVGQIIFVHAIRTEHKQDALFNMSRAWGKEQRLSP